MSGEVFPFDDVLEGVPRRGVDDSEDLHVWLDDLRVSSSVQLSYQML